MTVTKDMAAQYLKSIGYHVAIEGGVVVVIDDNPNIYDLIRVQLREIGYEGCFGTRGPAANAV